MTLEVTITDSGGKPLGNMEVSIVNNVTGSISSRYSDGNGYTNHAEAGPAGALCTFLTNGYSLSQQYYTLTADPDQKITLIATPFKRPFRIAPRFWKANMCGIRIPGLQAVPGGASDPSLFLSWFYGRYDAPTRAIIRAAMKQRGLTHWLVSWPDEQDFGYSPEGFKALCKELIADGFYPCAFLSAKPTSSDAIRTEQETLANIMLVLPLLIGIVPMFCVGWELSLWLSPEDVQMLNSTLGPLITPSGAYLYNHFQSGYFAYQINGQTTSAFWWANVGLLTGVLHQRDLSWDKPMYQARITDCLQRFAGQFGFPTDSGFGRPFDFVALEITAELQFNDPPMSEAEGDSWGQDAITTPPVGAVSVMGSGNGL